MQEESEKCEMDVEVNDPSSVLVGNSPTGMKAAGIATSVT